ncbi:MAG TPA: ATP-binding protein [Ramlibacter sp.]|jgi:PAS domain S-box-containing protein|uniref:hybrid sensor histidine kinase/response regulator n=1 Tax=Ramlibacter sp. TaxID=1917967 RepID=UPI002D394CE9|nr:ATP-binding protein [Ramlibacter sp.]HZY18379.1 ATP-binding protein [Ramlibacter sp.]
MFEPDTQPGRGLRAGTPSHEELDGTGTTIVWSTDADGEIRRPLPSWETFTGQPWEHYRGQGWLDAVHPDDRTDVLRLWRHGVSTRRVVEMGYRLRRRDGAYRQVTVHGAPMLDGDQLREWVGVCVDVTASREAAASLRDSEERFRFLDRLGQQTRVHNDANRVMEITARLLGEYLGATRCAYADVEPDGNRFTIRSDWSLQGVPSSAGVYSLDLFGSQATSRLRRGEPLVVHDVDAELGDEGGGRMFNAIGIKAIICAGLVKEGRLVAMMAVHQAVPRRWTGREVALVHDVVDRCWAHIERVRDSAMLREQDRRKDEFLATLAHELRNPLAPMKYAVAMMRLAPEPSAQARAQEVIDRQVSQMARLIDDLLDLSRINRGMIQLQRESVRLRTLLERAVEIARPAIETARHRLELQLPEEDLMLDADPARVIQIVGNLLNNAAKYTPDGGELRLAAWRAGMNAVLEVTDNGIGIPPEEQGKLFQMFTQLHHTSARAKGGLGIGLALVRTLVQMHGGSVRVASDGLDEGTRFTVELPLAAQPARQPQPGGATESAAGTRRVLVVEDNRDGLETLLALLDMLGYEVAGAGDGREALEQARRFRPDVVLLDLGLPIMDGFEVARALRQDPQHRHVFIAALTGWGAEADRRRTAEAGFDAHLTKPVELDALEEALARSAGTRTP